MRNYAGALISTLVVLFVGVAVAVVLFGRDEPATIPESSQSVRVVGLAPSVEPGNAFPTFGPFTFVPPADGTRIYFAGEIKGTPVPKDEEMRRFLEAPGGWQAREPHWVVKSFGQETVLESTWTDPDGRKLQAYTGNHTNVSTRSYTRLSVDRAVTTLKMLGDVHAVSESETDEYAASIGRVPLRKIEAVRDGLSVWLESREFSEAELEQIMLAILF